MGAAGALTILDFLGTGSGTAACTTMTPGPSDTFVSGTTCGTEITLAPGQVVVELQRSGGPPRFAPIDPADAAALQPGERYVTVGGLPAIAGEDPSRPWGSDLALAWTLSLPADLNGRYRLDAFIKGPGVAEKQAQVWSSTCCLSACGRSGTSTGSSAKASTSAWATAFGRWSSTGARSGGAAGRSWTSVLP